MEQRLAAGGAPRRRARSVARIARGRPAARAVAAALVLAACSRAATPPTPYLCPRVAIINGLESLEHRAPAPASGEVDYRAALENIDGSCRPEGGDLVVGITVDLVVQPAAGLANRLVEVPYFVAVSAPNGDVLDRQDFVAKVNLAPGARSGGVTESFSQRFVGRGETGATGYQVLFGFALPDDEALRQRQQP